MVPSTTTLPSTRALPASTPMRLRRRLTITSIVTTSPGCTGPAEADALDAGEEGQPLAVFRLRQNQDRADLGDGLCQNRRRQHEPPVGRLREIALVRRDVLDADDPLVDLELGDAIDEQERIAVRQNLFDGRVVQRQRQRIHRD